MKKIICDFCGKECDNNCLHFEYPTRKYTKIKKDTTVIAMLDDGIKLDYVDCCKECAEKLSLLINH